MPKDLTKLSLKEFDMVSEGEIEQRMRWNNGHLEMTVRSARYGSHAEDDDSES